MSTQVSTPTRCGSMLSKGRARLSSEWLGTADLFGLAAMTALAVLVVNDRILKARFANAVTGKLSDIAGLVLLPLVLFTAAGLAAEVFRLVRMDRKSLITACVLVAGLGFSAIQIWEPASSAYEWTLTLLGPGRATNTMDPTDLFALPVLVIPWLLVVRSRPLNQKTPRARRAPGER